MLAYITSSPLFKKGKKKKKNKETDADNLDDLLFDDDSDSDSENRHETTTNTPTQNSYYSPSNKTVYLKRECIELKIKVNALEEELASIPNNDEKGKETHVERARKMMEKTMLARTHVETSSGQVD